VRQIKLDGSVLIIRGGLSLVDGEVAET
jgi:hypothetical protein